MKYQDIYPRRQQPFLNSLTWSLTISGKVRHPLIFSYSDVLQLPTTEIACAIPCAGNLFDESFFEPGRWSGVPVTTLLDSADIDPTTTHAIVHNANQYSTSLPLDWLRRGVLAFEQDGQTLQPEQGYPLRLIVPGLYGYKMPRWLTRIELTDSPTGFWEARGWRDAGVAPAFAGITSPHHRAFVRGDVSLEGFAFSGQTSITSVEVSIDDADWMPVETVFTPPAQLTHWQVVWTPPSPGDYSVQIRAAAVGTHSFAPEHQPLQPVSRNTLHNIIIHVTE